MPADTLLLHLPQQAVFAKIDRDPAGARLGALLQVLVAREPSRGMPLIRAWWPRAFPVPPQVEPPEPPGRTRTCPGTIVESSRSFRCLISQTPLRGSA